MNEDHPDVKYWRKMAPLFKQAEHPEAAEATGPERQALIDFVNKDRRARGIPELVNDEIECPELGLHRIAAARGLIKRST